MTNFRELEQRVLGNARIQGQEIEELKKALYVGGTIDRPSADFLVVLRKRAARHAPAFDTFFYQAIKDHVLADGRVSAEEAAWLRQMVLQDGQIHDEDRQFLRQVRGEAKQVSPEFESLFAECMKQPMEQRTSG